MTRIAWWLNLDAEEELRAPQRPRPPSWENGQVLRACARIQDLLQAEHCVLQPVGPHPRPLPRGDWRAQAWCPTPAALRGIQRCGLEPPPAPDVGVLRAVNCKSFALTVGAALPGARVVTSAAELESVVAGAPPAGVWRVKREFGFAGRGQRLLAAGPLEASVRRWACRCLAEEHRLVVQPQVERLADYALHGLLQPDGTCRLGRPLRQDCDPRGVWLRSSPAEPGDLHAREHDALLRTAERVAGLLHTHGYFGPFGLDAFRWRDAGGLDHFHPLCEINARYSMAWGTGMGTG